jgi:hypothetical protein
MARLRSLEYGVPWVHEWLEEPTPGDPALNGAYRGSLPVRHVAQGLSGADLGELRPTPAPGQIWRRGPLTVRVLEVTAATVRFLELDRRHNTRRIRRCEFIRSSRLKAER